MAANATGAAPFFADLSKHFSQPDGSCWQSQSTTSWLARSAARPIVLFIMGTEGSGHNFYQELLRGTARENHASYSTSGGKKLHVFDNRSVAGFACILTTAPNHPHDSPELRAAMDEARGSRYLNASIRGVLFNESLLAFFPAFHRMRLIVLGEDAYPCGTHRHGWSGQSWANPEVAYLKAWDGELYDLRVLITYRHPVDATISNLRRGFVKLSEWREAARTTELGLHLIAAARRLRCEQQLLIPYEDARSAAFEPARAAAYTTVLSEFLRLDAAESEGLARGLASTAKPRASANVSSVGGMSVQQLRSLLTAYFAPRQLGLEDLFGGRRFP